VPDQFADRVGPILQGQLTQGETLRGDRGGDGMLGGLAGGQSQTEGVRALVEWLNANAPRG
jgi:hypothetical protein